MKRHASDLNSNAEVCHMKFHAVVLFAFLSAALADATPFFFTTGNPDGLIAVASRPSGSGLIEIEAADDFILSSPTLITSATFVGLLPTSAPLSTITSVDIEIYRVFPADSDVSRTSGAPTFSTVNVPTRVNSPSDVEFDSRSSGSDLTFTAGVISAAFTAANSVVNGIIPKPNQQTGGEGSVTGEEVQFNVVFTNPFSLPADHYFFVPQVQLSDGTFLWLSAPRPIVPPGTPLSPDLQAWIRNENLQPDWLRVGTDIVGGNTTFNMTFSLVGETVVPEPATLAVSGLTLLAVGLIRRRLR